mmetsp:Transcript_72995/g.194798  ORF Transcript_72995/g.194798 Transcript_72995/m.194798 type:complete len:259 (+) Transcript_72995:175-951(+)
MRCSARAPRQSLFRSLAPSRRFVRVTIEIGEVLCAPPEAPVRFDSALQSRQSYAASCPIVAGRGPGAECAGRRWFGGRCSGHSSSQPVRPVACVEPRAGEVNVLLRCPARRACVVRGQCGPASGGRSSQPGSPAKQATATGLSGCWRSPLPGCVPVCFLSCTGALPSRPSDVGFARGPGPKGLRWQAGQRQPRVLRCGRSEPPLPPAKPRGRLRAPGGPASPAASRGQEGLSQDSVQRLCGRSRAQADGRGAPPSTFV